MELEGLTNKLQCFLPRLADDRAPWKVRHVSAPSVRASFNHDDVFHFHHGLISHNFPRFRFHLGEISRAVNDH